MNILNLDQILPDPKSFKLFIGFVLLFVAFKLIKDVWAKSTGGQEESCSVEDRVDNVSLGLKKTRFEFKDVPTHFPWVECSA